MQVSGQVSQVKSRNTSFGEFFDVLVNGKSYGHGKFPPRGIQAGDFVTFEVDVVQKGQYTNYNIRKGSLRKDDNPQPAATQNIVTAAAPATAPYAGKQAYVPFDERQEIISKQAAMNTGLAICDLALKAGAFSFPSKAKEADKLGLLHQWVLETAQKAYKLSTGREMDVSAFGVEEPSEKPVARSSRTSKAEESPLPDEGYDEYGSA